MESVADDTLLQSAPAKPAPFNGNGVGIHEDACKQSETATVQVTGLRPVACECGMYHLGHQLRCNVGCH